MSVTAVDGKTFHRPITLEPASNGSPGANEGIIANRILGRAMGLEYAAIALERVQDNQK